LSLVHDFLKTFTERQQQAQTKLEQESPYFGRQA